MALTLVLLCLILFVWAHFSQKLADDLQQRNAEQRDLLVHLSESWRADRERHHEETIEAIKVMMAKEQVPFQGHLDDFNRVLAAEVRMLLGEVGRSREERRALQQCVISSPVQVFYPRDLNVFCFASEIADLLSMKSKYGPGGEYEPDWKPPCPAPPSPPAYMAPPPALGQPIVPPLVRPAWRGVHSPREKGKKKTAEPSPAASTLSPQPSPTLPPPHTHTLLVPPGTPPANVGQSMQSWATWHPEDNGWISPPAVMPVLTVPGRKSPGLFGPRSPASSDDWHDR